MTKENLAKLIWAEFIGPTETEDEMIIKVNVKAYEEAIRELENGKE